MHKIGGILLKSRDNHKAWTPVKSYCFSANANPAFWCNLEIQNKRHLIIPIYSKHAESLGLENTYVADSYSYS